MSRKPIKTALDGFDLHRVTLRPNNGIELSAYLNDSTLYVLRVDSRAGHVMVSWDGLACFDNGTLPQGVRASNASRLALAERVREACAERVRQWLESLPNAKVSEDRTRPVGWIPTINTPDACVKFVKDTDLSKLVEGE